MASENICSMKHSLCYKDISIYSFFQRPELTFRLEKNYFELNFKGFESEYELKENFYVRNVVEADLNLNIDDINDSKFL